jgi:hypothetical protein
MSTLYEQYKQAGQGLPSVQERQGLATQAGIQNYAGTAEQNMALGNYISTNKIDLSKPIPLTSLGQTSGAFPQPQPDNTNYAGIMSGIQGGLTTQQTEAEQKRQADTDMINQAVKQYFGSDNQQSSADLYSQMRGETGISEKEQRVNDLTAQLNQIVAESQAGQLGQEGRLASMGAISGAQRDIERQAAIRALPIQAQLAAAQGNLQTAQSNLETLFKLKSEDAERKYNRESEIRKFVYQFATDKEKRELDAQQREEDRVFEMEMTKYKNDLAQETARLTASLKPASSGLMGGSYDMPTLSQEQSTKLDTLGLAPHQQEVVAGIMRGEISPIPSTVARTKENQMILGGLAALGYDNTAALRDHTAMMNTVKNMTSSKAMELRRAVISLEGSTQQAERLYQDWQNTGLPSGFSSYNKAALQVAARLPGESGVAARTLLSHIEDMAAELAVIYRGGGQATDSALQQAQKSLAADWNEAQFAKNLALIRENLTIRRNSIAGAIDEVLQGNTYAYDVPGGQSGQTQVTPQKEDIDIFKAVTSKDSGNVLTRIWNAIRNK